MCILFHRAAVACAIWALWGWGGFRVALGQEGAAKAGTAAKAPARKPYGIEHRVPWTTSKIHGTPEPPPPYRVDLAFKNLKFEEPLELAPSPRGDRLYVVQRRGKIYWFENRPDVNRPELLMDLGKTAYGLALHPKFDENGYVYVVYVLDPDKPSLTGTRLARFTAGAPDRRTCDPKSEKVLLEWPSGGHNGGCLTFGPDGYLYIVTGDGSGIADELQTGQDISDLLGAILRIDVDRPTAARPYSIPPDNPFAGAAGARPEIWAYGLRQPWKINFDREERLWAGEVGQDLWESLHIIQRGGNYGWSVVEGSHPFRPERKRGPTPILAPLVEHTHADFRSITGGHVYYGSRLPELRGAYIYGDYDTGRIWGLRYDGQKVIWNQELVDTSLRVIDFCQDRAGEVFILDWVSGQIHQLVKAEAAPTRHAFPRKLSETGLFASVKDHQPAPGLIPYSVNSALWSDGAHKERFLALPGDSKIELDSIIYPQPAPGSTPGWRFPDGTVVVKTFSLETEPGNPSSRRRIETRLLHFEQLAGTEEVGDQYWRGYTYVWNDDQTDAVLVDAAGLDQDYELADPEQPGGKRIQKWHFPSRAECTLCHTMPAKYVLGLNTAQMNKDHDYGGVIANQLATFEHLGLFTKPLPDRPERLPKLADHEDPSAPLDARARAYLQSNCSHCHRKWGGGNAEFQLLATLPLEETGALNARPGQGEFGVQDARIIAPGDPARSLLLYRMRKLGLGRMPHVASNVVDETAAKLIEEWIRQLPAAR
jgi:uncharacterized repeat protein (TIGR03806 family)